MPYSACQLRHEACHLPHLIQRQIVVIFCSRVVNKNSINEKNVLNDTINVLVLPHPLAGKCAKGHG